jgi:hypothetical protein
VWVRWSSALGWTTGRAGAGKSNLVGGVKLDDPPILNNQGDRAVLHALEQAGELGDKGVQIVASRRVETGQTAPPGSCRRNIDESERMSRK